MRETLMIAKGLCVFVLVMAGHVLANDSKDATANKQADTAAASANGATKQLDAEALEQKFRDTLTNAVFEGTWQMTTGGDDPATLGDSPLTKPQADKYTISKVTKVAGDRWFIMARIEYGEKDVTIPVPVRVVWAEDTPIITLDEIALPGLGTYSARVMVYGRFYCGTWFGSGDEGKQCYGGVLSGRIVNSRKLDSKSNQASGS